MPSAPNKMHIHKLAQDPSRHIDAPNLLPMKGFFVTKFESKVNCQLQNYKKKVLNCGGYSIFGVSLN